MLTKIQKIIDDLNSTNSTNDKKAILLSYSKDEDLKRVLFYTYNPLYQFYVSPENVEKLWNIEVQTQQFDSLFDMLDALRSRSITGHKAIKSVVDFVKNNIEHKALIYKILAKDIEIRMGESLINKVIPDLIPTFDVALATDINKVNPSFASKSWYASRKLDGVRCVCIVDEFGHASSWSRQGVRFETLRNVENEIESLGLKDVVFDGEMCLVDKNGNENFQDVMKQIRRKDHTIENPKYLVFDLIDGKDFRAQAGNVTYPTRNAKLALHVKGMKFVEHVKQTLVSSEDHYIELMDNATSNGWEGLILRSCIVGYEGKRSKHMLKCKKFKDAEYKVEGIVMGPFRMIIDGVEVTREVMSNVTITHRGNSVSVGSGFTIAEREYYYAHPEEILGKIITVKYFEESQNQTGTWSLRFPVVKAIHGDKRTT